MDISYSVIRDGGSGYGLAPVTLEIYPKAIWLSSRDIVRRDSGADRRWVRRGPVSKSPQGERVSGRNSPGGASSYVIVDNVAVHKYQKAHVLAGDESVCGAGFSRKPGAPRRVRLESGFGNYATNVLYNHLWLAR